MEHFSKVFLEKYVKPSASITARDKLAVIKQGKYTVERYVSYFKQVRSQINAGTMVAGQMVCERLGCKNH